MRFDNRLRGASQIARAAVVAEPLPELHERVLVHVCKIADGWKCREKSQIVAAYHVCARLLEHDLRDPHMVRRRLVAPRQLAGVGRGSPPCQQCITEVGEDGAPLPRLYLHSFYSPFRLF